MNIFILDKDPKMSAKMMVDKHIVKMPLESMQMISTCLRLRGFDAPYRSAFMYHPCTIWARESSQNMAWLVEHFKALCEEYTLRYGKTHKCEIVFSQYASEVNELIDYLPDKGLTPFVQAMPEPYQNNDVVKAYRTYYVNGKNHIADWKTEIPEWWNNEVYKMC